MFDLDFDFIEIELELRLEIQIEIEKETRKVLHLAEERSLVWGCSLRPRRCLWQRCRLCLCDCRGCNITFLVTVTWYVRLSTRRKRRRDHL